MGMGQGTRGKGPGAINQSERQPAFGAGGRRRVRGKDRVHLRHRCTVVRPLGLARPVF